jgi:Ti-type conjugative transfer relaxase TraA
MLSISNGHAGYYANLAERDDYYNEGKEPPGQWHGSGSLAFGLSGEVDKQRFYALCSGFDFRTGEKLVHHAGTERRRALWDFTFSAAKGISCWWAMTDEATRARIGKCHLNAVKFTLDYIERNGFIGTRAGRSGKELDPCKELFFALYEHATSREQDPELHTHAALINLGINPDGQTRTLDPAEAVKLKMLFGAIYRAELSRELQREFAIEPERLPKGMFDVKGVPEELKDDCSKRRKQIVETMEQEGARGAKAAATFSLTTRKKKEHIHRKELFQEWGELGKEHGLDEREVINRREFAAHTYERTRESLDKAVSDITRDKAYFTQFDLLRQLAIEAQYTGAGFKECEDVAEKYLSSSAVHLRTENGRKIYTTPEIDALEKRMLAQVIEGKGREFQPFGRPRKEVDASHLSDEQRRAVRHVTEEKGSVKVVSGMAGTGKTTMLKAAREIWESRGFEVKGVSLAAIAAKNLESEAGITSQTIAKILHTIDNPRGEFAPPITAKTVLVCDEAGMVGTRQMARLIEETTKAGAKLVLVGDERQLQPIEHGAPFKTIGDLVGKAELKEIRRQSEEWAREAVHNFADGKAEEGLMKYFEQGLVTFKPKREEAINELVSTWKEDRAALKDKLIVASTNREVRELNELAQRARREAGELGKASIAVNGYEIFQGDRVLFTKNNKRIGVTNGESATVKAIQGEHQTIAVRFDGGELRIVPLSDYQDISLGYVKTAHKAQGQTVQNSYVYVSPTMLDRETSYVKMSRHKGAARLYMAVEEVGESFENAAKLMNQSHQKQLAQEQREPQQPREQRANERGIIHSR